jgi:hypothetical protein
MQFFLAGICMNLAKPLDLGVTPPNAASPLNESDDGQQAQEPSNCPLIDTLLPRCVCLPSMIPEPRGTNLGINHIPNAISLHTSHDAQESTLAVGILLIQLRGHVELRNPTLPNGSIEIPLT